MISSSSSSTPTIMQNKKTISNSKDATTNHNTFDIRTSEIDSSEGDEKPFAFGDFCTNDDLLSYNLKDSAIEFLCDTINATKSWVEGGSKDNFTYLNSLESQELKSCIIDLQQNLQQHEKLEEEKVKQDKEFNVNKNEQDSVKEDTLINERTTDSNVATPVENKEAKPNTWASLFKSSSAGSSSDGTIPNTIKDSSSPLILSVQMNDSEPSLVPSKLDIETDLSLMEMDGDERAHKLADTISELIPNFSRHHLQLRGLINRGNWCYINTTLQALLGIPAISHFYKALKGFLNKNARVTSTPLTDSMIQFFNEFEPINPKISLKKQSDDLRTGVAFEPKFVYDVLPVMKTSLSEKGRQEDAEEFLSFLLNGIHDELVALHKISTPKTPQEKLMNGNHENLKENENDEESWEQVGPKNKSSTMRKAVIEESLVKHIFGGVIRSSVNQTGMKESTTLQPFFTLQLDIQSDEIWTLDDAIKSYFVKETLQGFNCPKTNTEVKELKKKICDDPFLDFDVKVQVEASRRLSLEELPLMFIFHLKYFVFDRKGGCQKLHKHIDIPVDLEIPKDVMSASTKNKTSTETRKYKLYAVIYHHGKYTAGGHYTASVHHGNPFGWVNYDDNLIKTVSISHVLKYQQGSIPYLLFYERIPAR